jgi:DNA-binding transcriptional regulator LsrR (DeoR family)
MLLFGEYTDYRVMLEDLYCTQKLGLEEIADRLGVNKICVRNTLAKECNVKIRPKGRPRFKDKQIKIKAVVDLDTCTLATLSIRRKAIKH